MMRFWRGRRRATTIPVFDASFGHVFRNSMIKLALVIGLPLLALAMFGQPALRVQYWYHGLRSDPVFERCLYVAFDGWHVVTPGYRGSAEGCPLILLVPAYIPKLIWG